MMTESEFIRLSEELFEHIEDQIDENGWDFDCQFAGNVLTIEAETARKSSSTATRPTKNCGLPPKAAATISPSKTANGWHTRRTGFLQCFERSTECGFGRSSQYCQIVIESLNPTR